MLAVLPPDAAVVATTGKCGRELFTLADREQHLYQVGSMGCASGMGLGVALATGQPTVVLDGDGAALMKLGTMASSTRRISSAPMAPMRKPGSRVSLPGYSTIPCACIASYSAGKLNGVPGSRRVRITGPCKAGGR